MCKFVHFINKLFQLLYIKVIKMPPAMGRPRAFTKSKQKAEQQVKQDRDKDWDVTNYISIPGSENLSSFEKDILQGNLRKLQFFYNVVIGRRSFKLCQRELISDKLSFL